MGRLLRKLAAGEIAFGSTDTLGSSRLLEVMGFAGLDMIMVDQMFCPADWETVANMVRAGRNYDVDTLVRIQSFPWLPGTDHRLAVDAARALGCGATGVIFSVRNVEEVEEVMEVSKDWHRDIHIHPFTEEGFATFEEKVGSECIIMPLIESTNTIDNIDKILAVPGLGTVWLAMTDVSRMLGQPFDYEHPVVTRFVEEAVAIAKQRGVVVGANVGYKFSRSMDEMVARVGRMVAQGIGMIWLQNDGYVIQWTYHTLLDRMRNIGARG